MSGQDTSMAATSRYRWGRLFVRGAAILAMAAVALGCLTAVAQAVLLTRAMEAARHRSSGGLREDVAGLEEGCRRAREVIAGLAGPDGVPPAPAAVVFPEAIRGPRDLKAAQAALAAREEHVDALKRALLGGFPESVEWLIGSLTRKAGRIRQQLQDAHGADAARLQARIDGLRRQLEDDGQGLYRPLDQAEYERRLDVLDQALRFLDYLGTLGGGDTVNERIAAARRTVERIRAGLPEPASEGRRLRLVQELAEARRALADLLLEGHRLEGEELAERLRVLSLEVGGAAEASWAVDAALQRVRERLAAEAEALAAVEQERGRLLRQGAVRIGAVLAVAAGAAVLLLLAADVLGALFDVAEALAGAPEAADPAEPASPADSGPAPPAPGPAPDAPARPGTVRRYLGL